MAVRLTMKHCLQRLLNLMMWPPFAQSGLDLDACNDLLDLDCECSIGVILYDKVQQAPTAVVPPALKIPTPEETSLLIRKRRSIYTKDLSGEGVDRSDSIKRGRLVFYAF